MDIFSPQKHYSYRGEKKATSEKEQAGGNTWQARDWPSEKKEVLEKPSTRKDMGEKGHEQKLENHKEEQTRVRKN